MILLLKQILAFLISTGLYWAAYKYRYLLNTDVALFPVFMFLFGSAGYYGVFLALSHLIPNLVVRRQAMRTTGLGGTADWSSPKEIRKAGMRKKKGFLMGLNGDAGVFADIESSGLVLGPAGTQKTVGFGIPALCHNPISMLVLDLKGTYATMTAWLRKKKLKNEVIFVNPGKLYARILAKILGAAMRYNPMQILIDDWLDPEKHHFLFSDARGMAKQLHSDPANQGENQYFRNGARKFLVFAFVYLVINRQKPTLTDALELLSDSDELMAALNIAKSDKRLKGDLARLAKDLLKKYDAGDKRQIESFREGAVQSLEVFSPSSDLAECTADCDFRYYDMRDKKLTIYLITDPTRVSTYAPWLALNSWCAFTELIRYPGKNPVCFLLDEITNIKIEGLPALLTLAREFKIKIWLIIQELEQWAHVYGREALDTALSQTEAKLIMASRSQKTCQLVSDMLGERSVKTKSHSIGRNMWDKVSVSLQENSRRIMTPDEVRRTEKSILFYRNMRPIELDKIGYHEISPWRRWVGINPLYGKKYKGRVRLRI